METVIAFIIIFGSLVFFHELGHFLFAKKAGIMVREFAIGFGPKLIGIMKGETLYTIRLLPLGGYVKMAGEDFDTVELQPGYRVGILLDQTMGDVKKIYLTQNVSNANVLFLEIERADLNKELFIEGYDEDGQFVRFPISKKAVIIEKGQKTLIAPYDRQFESKTVGQRAMAIFAGPLFNFILAFFIFLAIGLLQGVPTNEPVISDVQPDGPAALAGLQKGDVVTAVDGITITEWTDFSQVIQNNPGVPIQVNVERDGVTESIEITPAIIKDQKEKEYGQIGVYAPIEKNPFKAVSYGAERTVFWFKTIFELLGMLITGKFSIEALSGPVGIYKTTEQIAQLGIYNLMNWAAILSINLGIMNLLPLPALDGGRLLFFLFEAIRGKPVDRQKEGMVHFVGIMLLMVLMLIVTWNDIQRFFF